MRFVCAARGCTQCRPGDYITWDPETRELRNQTGIVDTWYTHLIAKSPADIVTAMTRLQFRLIHTDLELPEGL